MIIQNIEYLIVYKSETIVLMDYNTIRSNNIIVLYFYRQTGRRLLVDYGRMYVTHLEPLKWPTLMSLYICSSTRLSYPGSSRYQQ